MSVTVDPLLLSVVIPTCNRAVLLRQSLASLAAQTLARNQFEVVVVDDGSTDDTEAVCRRFAAKMTVRYFRIDHAGISAAKNVGVFAARGSLILFFDDDDVAQRDLFERHIAAHLRYPGAEVAVLGYTTWAARLQVSPLMHWATEIGHLMFSYSHLTQEQQLDFTYFWGGRTSCKRLLLVRHGVFNQDFDRIIEDMELGFRLSKAGLRVIFERNAVQFMNRPVTYEGFARRCEVQGGALWRFSRLHTDAAVQQYAQVATAVDEWAAAKDLVEGWAARVAVLEQRAQQRTTAGIKRRILDELYELYRLTFYAHVAKGKVSAMQAFADGAAHVLHDAVPSPPAEPPRTSRRPLRVPRSRMGAPPA